MSELRKVGTSPAGAAPRSRTFQVDATPQAVRAALAEVAALLRSFDVAQDIEVAIDLALAEILNNVVEHAYLASGEGLIHVIVDREEDQLQFTVIDDGRAMPAGRLPLGYSADPDLPGFEQAEGGYGMYMIRQLARKLRYHRFGEQNQLSFRVPLDRPAKLGD